LVLGLEIHIGGVNCREKVWLDLINFYIVSVPMIAAPQGAGFCALHIIEPIGGTPAGVRRSLHCHSVDSVNRKLPDFVEDQVTQRRRSVTAC
jgi:hypothetical protein